MYTLEQISYAYGPKPVLVEVSLDFDKGCFYGVIGPNGSGKTTLIDMLAGHLRPGLGQIHLEGRPLDRFHPKERACRIALVPQHYRMSFPYTCKEVVMMGRYPHIPRFTPPSAHDREIVDTVLRQADLKAFTHRYIDRLSGGEAQRVVFARGLAQETDVLLLDEATSNMDMQHSLAMLNLAADRVTPQRLVVAVMQDVNLAAMYCDRLVCLKAGAVFAQGPPEQVLTPETLRAVFNVDAHVARHSHSGNLQVVFKRERAS